ncbi:MAG: formylglycine-generating enzyme family protein [Planctomycetota bacterium]|nr:formylglycine-generating enzyme family protein [Planctomycetota bacterium]
MIMPLNALSRVPYIAVVAAMIAHSGHGISCATAQDLTAGKSPETLLKGFVEECLLIEPGIDKFPVSYQMGRHFDGPFALPELTVTLTQSFRISRFEMTQELYTAVMGKNPSRWTGPRNSVESMSFLDAEAFCTKLTARLLDAKLVSADEVVRLPTEAEWEYCCRAGTETRYSFGDAASIETDKAPVASILNEYAWHTGNAAGNDPAVGVLKPNPWGLYDMHGYLWEFVSHKNTHADTAVPGAETTPQTTTDKATRIIRGGSWRDPASQLTCGARKPISDHASSDAIGFRCVIAQKPQP